MRTGTRREGTFILDMGGRRFYSTSINKASLEEIMANLRKFHPAVTFVLESFFVKIKKRNPDNDVVTDWAKEKGFSIWYSPVGNL